MRNCYCVICHDSLHKLSCMQRRWLRYLYLLMRDSGVRNYNEFDEHVGLTEERRLSWFFTSIHSKSEKVCGTAFSVKKKCVNPGVIFGPFWIILGQIWATLGHFWAILWHFWTNLRKVQIFLRPCWYLLFECMSTSSFFGNMLLRPVSHIFSQLVEIVCTRYHPCLQCRWKRLFPRIIPNIPRCAAAPY